MTHKAPVAIEVVRRSLLVLECLNRRRTTTLRALYEETGLPKPTLLRVLETLAALGYAEQVSRTLGYRITDRVLNLSSGLRFIDHLVDVAIPYLRQFTNTYGWPIYLAQITGGVVNSRYTTSPESPLSFENTFYNQPIRAIDTAIGNVSLAHAPADEWRTILLKMGELGETPAQEEREFRKFEAIFKYICQVGYAVTPAPNQSRMLGIAVPLIHRSRSIGGLAMRFPRSVMTERVVVEKFLQPLQAVARRIVEQALPNTDLAVEGAISVAETGSMDERCAWQRQDDHGAGTSAKGSLAHHRFQQ